LKSGVSSPTARDRSDVRREQEVIEELTARLSARLANGTFAHAEASVDAVLRELVEVLGYDRCTYAEFDREGFLNVLQSVAIPGVVSHPPGRFGATLRWFTAELRAGRVVALPDLPRGLPADAIAEATLVRSMGLRSHLSIPLRVAGRIAGVLAFAAVRRTRAWPAGIVRRLTIVGELIATTLARKRIEEEAERLRTRLWHADRVARTGALTAAIAHELNQPMAAILSNAQAGLERLRSGSASPEELRTILEAIVRDDKRAADTIRSVRALLRQDGSGRTRVDVGAAVGEVVRLLESDLARRGIHVETRLDAGCCVIADRMQIEQVALNLVQNAADALRARPRDRREVRVSVAAAPRNRVEVAVSDSGSGVAPEHMGSIFEPFWTTRPDGLGLGLAICRSIVEAHGGEIRAEPNAEAGVTFKFDLPAVPAAEVDARPDAAAPAALPGPHAATREQGPLVCVVDDDASVRESLVRLLDACGCRAVAFVSGQALLEKWPVADAACLLLDLRLPDMSGLELQRMLNARGDVPPVVFMTGHGDAGSGVDAMKQGAFEFLEKPVDAEVLVGVLRDAFARGATLRVHDAERSRCLALVARLSPREREVTAHVVRGRLNKQIAADLGISEQTVKQHRGRVMAKLEVRSVPDLVRIWEIAGMPRAAAARRR
jgi:FixJ family two-component response regulator/signal transduction histidine kinase